MSVNDLKFILRKLKKMCHDPEAAHGLRDDIWQSVLKEVASGAYNGQELAEVALETEKIEFPRWYA